MAICKYFAEGRCRFGDRCYNEHIVDNRYEYQQNHENRYSYINPGKYRDHSSDSSSYHSPNRNQESSSSRSSYHSPIRYPQYESPTTDKRCNQYEDNYGYNRSYDRSQYSWHASDSVYEHKPSRYDFSPSRQSSVQASGRNKGFSFQRESPSPPHHTYENSQNRSSRYDSTFSKSAENNYNSSKSSAFHLTKNRQEAFSELKHEKEIMPHQYEINLVKEDMVAWDEGKQWSFSCYCPFKGHPQFPDFNDISPEELRHEAYEAKKNNNFPTYVKSVTEATNIVKEQRNLLKNPSPETSELIRHISKQPVDTGSDQSKTFHFSSASMTENSAVSKDQPSGFLFGKPTSTFSSSSSSGGGFNLQHLTSAASKGTPPESMSVVQMTENSKPATSESVFNLVLSKKAVNFSFKTPDAGVASKTPSKHSIYTPLEDLTTEEREAFEAPVFVLGKIPVRPPPYELCF